MQSSFKRNCRIAACSIILFAADALADQYTFLIYEEPASIKNRFDPDPVKMKAYWAEFNQFAGILQQAGVLRGGTAFKLGNEIKSVKIKNGKIEVSTGSYAKSEQILGGDLVLELPSLKAAVEYAKKAPTRSGMTIEVRAPQEGKIFKGVLLTNSGS